MFCIYIDLINNESIMKMFLFHSSPQVSVMGAPAEEAHGGKIDLISAGAFKDVDVAMMAHPDLEDDHEPIMLAVEG